MDGGTPDRDPLPRLLSCNMETILRNGCGTLYPLIRFNEFTRQPEFHSHDGGALEATDAMYSKLQSVVSRDFQVEFKETILFAQADVVAHTNSYHPVQDYLRSIQWDGEERVETWLTTYLGVEDTPYSRAVAGIILCGAVQRIMRPGSKFDYMLILEGGQGLNKSKAVAALVPRHSWFTDVGLDMRDKEATAQNIQGKWVIEVGELKGMRESTAEQIKQFITRRDDRFRPPYGRAARDWPRQCIFIGTTNQRHYLFDSANRRHLPVRCTKVDDEGIAAMRDQLWAEAVVKMENAKSAFHLYPVIEVIARDEQEDRRVVDPWEEALETFLSDRNKVHTRELLCALGYTDVGTQDQALWSRLTRVMQTFANDWDYSTRTSSDHANFTGRHRGYRRKTPLTAVTGNVFTFDPGHGNRKAPLVDAGGQPINEKKE